VSDSYFSITPFSATLNCGAYANTWTYIGYNNSDGRALNQATDLIGVDSTTGSIFVSKYKPRGTYQVKIIGTLPEYTTSSAIFTVAVLNTAPVFKTSLADVPPVPLMSSYNYLLPEIFDPDVGDNPTVTVENSTG
jgi:hypothetical protein